MALKTDMQIKAIKLTEGKAKAKFAVGDGLFLLVTQSGKYWKYAYSYNEKRKEASLGVYPKVSMKAAKAKLPEIKSFLAEGLDPNQLKREKKMANKPLRRFNSNKRFKTPIRSSAWPGSGMLCMNQDGQISIQQRSCAGLSCMCSLSLGLFQWLI